MVRGDLQAARADRDNEHFEFYWFPHSEGCLTKRNNRSDGPASPLPGWRHWLDDEFLSNSVFGATSRLGQLAPGTIPRVNAAASKALSARSYTDAPFRVFTSPRRVRFKEQEYAIPAEHLAATLAEVRALFDRKDWRISFPIEVRIAPADEPWLSTAHGRDSAYIAIHVFHASPHADYFARGRVDHDRRRRPSALGQDAHEGRRVPARRLPEVH